MSRPPLRPAVDGHNGRPISWPSHPTRTRSARHGFGPPLGPAGREVAVIATLAAEGPAPLHPPTASIRAATGRTAMPSAGEAVGGSGASGTASPAYGIDSGCDTPYGDAVSG